MMNIKKKISLKPLKVKKSESETELQCLSPTSDYYLVEILPGLFIAGWLIRLWSGSKIRVIVGEINWCDCKSFRGEVSE